MENTRTFLRSGELFAPTLPKPGQKLKAILRSGELFAWSAELELCWLVARGSQALLPYRPLALPAVLTALIGLAAGYLIELAR